MFHVNIQHHLDVILTHTPHIYTSLWQQHSLMTLRTIAGPLQKWFRAGLKDIIEFKVLTWPPYFGGSFKFSPHKYNQWLLYLCLCMFNEMLSIITTHYNTLISIRFSWAWIKMYVLTNCAQSWSAEAWSLALCPHTSCCVKPCWRLTRIHTSG